MRLIIPILIASVIVAAGLLGTSVAGHYGNYHHGYCTFMQDLASVDANKDGAVSFDEFSAPQTQRLKGAFNMLDTDNDEIISEAEWKEFLEVHGMGNHSKQ